MMSGMLGGKIGPTIADATVTAAGKVLAEAAGRHRLHLDAAEAPDVGQRRAAHPGEDQARERR